MQLVERTFRLTGPEGLGAQPRPGLIGPLLTHLPETLQDAVRMGFLHSSRARGRISNQLKAAAEVRFVAHEGQNDGSTLLHFAVPRFGDVAGEWFRQGTLWQEGPQPEHTAFELLGLALRDVEAQRKDSARFDRDLLRRVGGYQCIINRGLSTIELQQMDVGPARINQQVIAAASELSASTPAPRRVRITGWLDVMGASEAVLKLEVRPGVVVTALWQNEKPIEQLREFFNRQVVLEGSGVFRASGSLLRIDADAVAAASQQDEFFRKLPEPMVSSATYEARARLRPGERSVYRQVLGSIAPEESDDAFIAAVEELS